MKLLYTVNRVLENVESSMGVFRLTVGGITGLEPGDIVFLRSWDKKPYLTRPIRVEECSNGDMTFSYELGDVQAKLLTFLRENDEVEIIGPFGNSEKTAV